MGSPCVLRQWAGNCHATCACTSYGEQTSNCTENNKPNSANDWHTPQELFDLISRVNDTVNYLSGLSKRGTVATRGCGECKLHEYGGDDGFDDSSR